MPPSHHAARGRAPSPAERIVYSTAGLTCYEAVVAASCKAVWRCPRHTLVELLYRPYTGARHLSIGVGSGVLLEKAAVAADRLQELHLLDLSPGPLGRTAARLTGHRPTLHRADVLQPLPAPAGVFDSADLMLMLHCVRGGSIAEKAVVFDHVAQVLRPGGVVFGATVLAHGVPTTVAARALMAFYNRTGVFSNHGDSLADLEHTLRDRFDQVRVHTVGCVGLFAGVAR